MRQSTGSRARARRPARVSARAPARRARPSRGGVVVAREVADALGGDLDVVLVRKLGAPDRPELAIGAVGEGGVVVTNADMIRRLRLTDEEVEEAARREFAEIDRLDTLLRRGRPPLPLKGRAVVVVDDGIATGATTRAALRVVRTHDARWLALAVPVAPADILEELSHSTDHTVCPNPRVWMRAVGLWYRDFSPCPMPRSQASCTRRTRWPRRGGDHLSGRRLSVVRARRR
ncbi:phosphoribosyltransferase [Prauserella oleivorans]